MPTRTAALPRAASTMKAPIFSATGVDLRAATEKVLINGSLYNYALVLASGPMSQGTIDRLLAVYGREHQARRPYRRRRRHR